MAGSALAACAARSSRPGSATSSAPPGSSSWCSTVPKPIAIENRCSQEDTPLADGELDEPDCSIECPRHGSRFDLRTGRALNIPGHEPIEVFQVEVIDAVVTVEID